MGLDAKTIEAALEAKPADAKNAVILGDCAFHAPWRTGDNRADLETFRALAKLDSVATLDLFGEPTIRLDLHDELPGNLSGAFDYVIDAGTLFCCFDVAQVWRNILALLKPKGTVFHQAGMTGYMGRSYYSFHPMLFRDFYTTNEFTIDRIAVRANRSANDDYISIEPDAVFSSGNSDRLKFGKTFASHISTMPADMTIICAASRQEARPFRRAVPSSYYA